MKTAMSSFLLLIAAATLARAEVPFIRITCIDGTRYLSVEHVAMPNDGVYGIGSDSADSTALRAWQREHQPIWEGNGFYGGDTFKYSCRIGETTYEVTGIRASGLNNPDCDAAPAEVTVRSAGTTYIERLRIGPNCGHANRTASTPSLMSVRLWQALSETTPWLMQFCLEAASRNETCMEYDPHPGHATNPPITQSEWDLFFSLREARPASPGGTHFVRPSSDLTMFMFNRYPCAFAEATLPPDAVIYAVGGGKFREVPFRMREPAVQYMTDLPVNAPGKKVALLIPGHESAMWNIQWTTGTQIIAVAFVSGEQKVVAGLPRNVPIFSSYFGSGHACRQEEVPDFGFTGVRQRDRDQLNRWSMRLYGRPVDAIFGGSRQPIIAGEPLTPSTKLIQSSDTAPESFASQRNNPVYRKPN